MAVATAFTIDDLEKLPFDEERSFELVDGELIEVANTVGEHNLLRDYVVHLTLGFLERQPLGRVISEQLFQFGPDAHAPDVSFFGRDKVQLFQPKRRVQLFVPDLVFEVVSVSDTFQTLREKAARYRECGVKEVYILSQASREAFLFSESGNVILAETDLLQPTQIPGFSVRLGDLFDGCMPSPAHE